MSVGRHSEVNHYMKLFPPSPKNVDEATEYVQSIPRRKGKSDYRAICESAMGYLVIPSIFYLMMPINLESLPSTMVSVAMLLFGFWSMVCGVRTLQLLELWQNEDLETDDS